MDNASIFEAVFYDEMESWFCAGIACCENCYDEFLHFWPHAYVSENLKFQKNSISLDSFYSGSRLKDIYSKDEFFGLARNLECPRCKGVLSNKIYPYELPFDFAGNPEQIIQELTTVARRTPFLMMEHPFSKQILEKIMNLGAATKSSTLKQSVYRARKLTTEEQEHNIDFFDFPPNWAVGEGRYNHAGIPVLYLASDQETCHKEMRLASSLVIAEIEYSAEIRILDFVNPEEVHKDDNLLKFLVYSAFLSAKRKFDGEDKPEYIFSRFVADCAKAAGFDAIKYPSTQIERDSFNLVILNTDLSLSSFGKILSKILL